MSSRAAPIILPEGRRIGYLAMFDDLPRAYDADMAERLADHAAFVADQWQRGRVVQALARSKQRLKLAIEIANIHVWEMDYRKRQWPAIACRSRRHRTPPTSR